MVLCLSIFNRHLFCCLCFDALMLGRELTVTPLQYIDVAIAY